MSKRKSTNNNKPVERPVHFAGKFLIGVVVGGICGIGIGVCCLWMIEPHQQHTWRRIGTFALGGTAVFACLAALIQLIAWLWENVPSIRNGAGMGYRMGILTSIPCILFVLFTSDHLPKDLDGFVVLLILAGVAGAVVGFVLGCLVAVARAVLVRRSDQHQNRQQRPKANKKGGL